MKETKKATKIKLLDFKSIPMRTFHFAWFSFFLCFFGWFGIAPLMAIVREELQLTKAEIGNTIIASVAITILARFITGWLCDKYGPRKTYTGMMILGAIPVMLIGLSNSYETFLFFRLIIGFIGGSFVITQYHTSVMFAPNIVGTANATTAGWGNLGAGFTQMMMPLIFAGFIGMGFVAAEAWRMTMLIPGIALIIMGIFYYKFTQDTPTGNFGSSPLLKQNKTKKASLLVLGDPRVWGLFLIYGACFGIELTINNIAAIYFMDHFSLDLKTAGLIAGLFGLMNLFSRSLGGIISDKFSIKFGLKGRVHFLFIILLLEGVTLLLFAQITLLPLAIVGLVMLGFSVQMANGATYSVVPFINKKSMGTIAGIVGAGGNAGAVAAGFLFKSASISYSYALFILGMIVTGISFLSFIVRFSEADEQASKAETEASLSKEPAVVPISNNQ